MNGKSQNKTRAGKPTSSLATLSALAVALCTLCHDAGAAYLVVLRSDQSALPESILRETYATIDRCRYMLVQRCGEDGLWPLEDGSTTAFPALALADPVPGYYSNAVSRSISAAVAKMEGTATKPWNYAVAAEAAYTVMLQAIAGGEEGASPQLLKRLARMPFDDAGADPAARFLALLALEANNVEVDGRWAMLANGIYKRGEQNASTVALSALCRMAADSGSSARIRPGNDVLAHVRWLANKLDLGFGKETPNPDPVTPESAFLVAVLASQIPRQSLLSDNTLLPYNWRNHLANRLISKQLADPTSGLNYWDSSVSPSPFSDTALRETSYAIMALVLMAE